MTILAYSVSVLLMISISVLIAAALRRRLQIPWLLFCVGTLTFIGSQAVHLPLNTWLTNLGLLPEGTLAGKPLWSTALILGLSAGLCEELARTAGYALMQRFRRFEHGLMMGLGHGGIEAMVFGGVMTAATFSSIWGLQGTDLSTINLNPEQFAAVSQQVDLVNGSAWSAFIPLIERVLAMQAQITLSIIVLQAFSRKKWFYVPIAIVYHALIDGLLVYVAFTWENPLVTYGGFILLLIPSAVWLVAIAPKNRLRAAKGSSRLTSELKIFWLAFRKEMQQQWRSRRVIIVVAVFALFGLGSPLLAKFTPQIVSSVPGAEMFADLIPEPSIADATGQYIKNLTQFGFILAILLGMNAVVGEKERGTIAMILSKPMPRWVFLSSKLAAQSVVYLIAFLIAAVGAYYYTVILFGAFNFWQFMLINLLLFGWLLTFVGVTLLASVLGSSTAAAAGMGFGFSVVLLLAGNIPKVGPLAPTGLTVWAGQLGVGLEQVTGNGGALVMAVVLVLMCFITAMAVFERQEL